jgi:acetyltransferase-like isoleucine patch superfamily enzyme
MIKTIIINTFLLLFNIFHLHLLFPKMKRKLEMAHLMRTSNIEWNIEVAREQGVRIGEGCLIYGNAFFSTEPYLVEIGDRTTVSGNVTFLTHDGAVHRFNDGKNDIFNHFGRIKIGSNCFVGFEALFMPGVEIGDNCLVAARAVVTKKFPSNSVIVGNPAKRVSTIPFYIKSRMASPNTIRSKKYAFPNEGDMPEYEKKEILLREIKLPSFVNNSVKTKKEV